MSSMNEIVWREGLSSIAHKSDIVAELYKAFERLEAPPDLLSVIGSYGDTLSDEEVLHYLKDWNATGKVMKERCGHCPYASPTGCDGWCLEGQ